MTAALRAMPNNILRNEILFEYKGISFPVNPSTVEVFNGRSVKVKSAHGSNPITQDLGAKPTEIKGSGTFYCDDARERCERLAHLTRESGSGWLHCPYCVPIMAYLTCFEYKADSNKSSVSYKFELIEDCSATNPVRLFEYTQAVAGDNAFIIASREGVSVNDIMALNDYKTPFDIKEKDVVKIR